MGDAAPAIDTGERSGIGTGCAMSADGGGMCDYTCPRAIETFTVDSSTTAISLTSFTNANGVASFAVLLDGFYSVVQSGGGPC
jgi:hypothetical protein